MRNPQPTVISPADYSFFPDKLEGSPLAFRIEHYKFYAHVDTKPALEPALEFLYYMLARKPTIYILVCLYRLSKTFG